MIFSFGEAVGHDLRNQSTLDGADHYSLDEIFLHEGIDKQYRQRYDAGYRHADGLRGYLVDVDLDLALFGNHDILWFDVSVNDTVSVKEIQYLDNLVDVGFDHFRG